MRELMQIYAQFWAHNLGVAVFVHAMIVFVLAAAWQGVRDDRSMYHRRTRLVRDEHWKQGNLKGNDEQRDN